MAWDLRKDSFEMTEVTLSGLLSRCADCSKMCLEQTRRVVDNASIGPYDMQQDYARVAEHRRKEDERQCLDACNLALSSCPDVAALRAQEDFETRAAARKLKRGEVAPLSLQQMSRCEHAAEKISSVLFALAHKPTKITFVSRDPKTGVVIDTEKQTKMRPQAKISSGNSDSNNNTAGGGSPKPHGEVAHEKNVISDAILSRWSASRKARTAMESEGILHTKEELSGMRIKNDIERRKAQAADSGNNSNSNSNADSGTSGTAPRW